MAFEVVFDTGLLSEYSFTWNFKTLYIPNFGQELWSPFSLIICIVSVIVCMPLGKASVLSMYSLLLRHRFVPTISPP